MAVETGVTNLAEINKAFKQFVKLYEGDIGKSMRVVAVKLFAKLQLNTPRDSGRAINGWNVNINKKPSDWKPPKNQSHYIALSFPSVVIDYKSFINISNNVEYIIPLEEGHSMQKPNGFIELSMRETNIALLGEISKLNRRNYGL